MKLFLFCCIYFTSLLLGGLYGKPIDPKTPKNSQPYKTVKDPRSKWKLHWSDEFNDNKLDTSKWTKDISTKSRSTGSRDPALWWWGWTENNVWVQNGRLWLQSHKVNAHRLECGSVNTYEKFTTTFGYMEARISIQDPSQGSHTAFWLQGVNMFNVDGSGGDGAEIDIVEGVWTDGTTKSVVHIDGYGKNHAARTVKYNTPGINRGYHVFGLEWAPGLMKIFYDGELKVTYRGAFVPMAKEFLWLSVGASFEYANSPSGSNWASNSGADGFSKRAVNSKFAAKVDYVRVWKTQEKTYFRIKNRETNKFFKTFGDKENSQIKQSPTNHLGDWTTWYMEATNNGFFRLVNEGSGKYMRPLSGAIDASMILTGKKDKWTEWKFVKATGGQDFYILKNRHTGKHFAPKDKANNAALQQKPDYFTGNWVQWQNLEVVRTKKGNLLSKQDHESSIVNILLASLAGLGFTALVVAGVFVKRKRQKKELKAVRILESKQDTVEVFESERESEVAFEGQYASEQQNQFELKV